MPRLPGWLAILVALAAAAPARAQTTLNLSHDLTTLGIGATNMVPNQPALDAGPLLSSGVAYAMAHGIGRVSADPGTYYFLSLQTGNAHVQLGSNPLTPSVNNLTIDFQGANLIFTHPLIHGIMLWSVTNVVLENFTADYQPLPSTQVRVVSVDTAAARIQYTVEPGWQDPSAFNSAQLPQGTTFPAVEMSVYRSGRPAAGVRRIAVQTPLSGNTVTVIPYVGATPTPAFMAGIRPGDIAVLAMRHFGSPVVTYRCRGCTLRNITVYSAAGEAITGMYSESTTWERIYSVPKPGTDRLISSLEIGFQANGPNNQIRLSRAIRTLDGGITLHVWSTGEVQSQSAARTLKVAGVGPTTLAQGVSLADGSPVVFQRRSDGAILFAATMISQTGSANGYNSGPVDYTFDRDLPGNLIGSVMYTTASGPRGGNSIIERNTIQEKSCCIGMDTWGWAGSTVHGNYFSWLPWSAIAGIASTPPTTWTTPPLQNMTFSNNVLDRGNLLPDWWLHELGALQLVATRFDPQQGDYDLFPAPAHQNITIANNFISDPGRAAIWIGDTAGGSVSGNYLLHANERPQLAVYHSPRTDANAPLVVDGTSTGVVTANNTIDQTSGRVFVTDAQYRELAAYAPGSTIRLNGYAVGGLANLAVTLTDADGVTRSTTIQTTTANAIDVQVPAAAALGGAYLTVTSGATKAFGTLFLDSQDNIPALNGCIYEVQPSSLTVPGTASTLPILVLTQTACAYQVLASGAWVTPGTGGTGTGVISVAFAANPGAARSTTIEIAGQLFTITQTAKPTMTLDRSALVFGAVDSGTAFTAVTAPQTVRMTQNGAGTVTWTAASNAPWLVVSPTAGTGTATLTVSATFVAGLGQTQAGAITITFNGAGNSAGPINVALNAMSPAAGATPFGSFDTPADGTTGIAGSIAVTGWSLDDVQTTRVTICRAPVTGEVPLPDGACGGARQVYIGDASFVEGARPDVQAIYPGLPLNTRAGWGYLMLTNFLPQGGNGTFVLSAYLFDGDGHVTRLPTTKTITCDNAHSPAPFGAIDTPGQGATVSGVVANVGWVLSPGSARADPPAGGVVRVLIDGVDVGAPPTALFTARSDLQALFPRPQYAGIDTALGIFGLDTTTLGNGVHTIAWLVTATAGGSSGVGSRFFTVSNGNGGAVVLANLAAARSSVSQAAQVEAGTADDIGIQARRGFDLEGPLHAVAPSGGRYEVAAEELDRIEIRLGDGNGLHYSGSLRTVAGLMPLPAGSTLDPSTGVFTWMPGAGFIGAYDLVFDRWGDGQPVTRRDLRIVLHPKGSNRVGPQTVIDRPGDRRVVDQPFVVAGWAADLDAPSDTGVSAIHVWAYPVDNAGRRQAPIFLGTADYGGARPDVAAIFGYRVEHSAYGLVAGGLAPGTYDLAVFAFSTVTGTFTPAKVVRVVIR